MTPHIHSPAAWAITIIGAYCPIFLFIWWITHRDKKGKDGVLLKSERQLVVDFMNEKPDSLKILCQHLINRPKPFMQTSYCTWVGALGGIRVENDHYGYEVKLGWSPHARMVDCTPGYYGLTQEQGDALFEAILTCVPGSIHYNKSKRNG